MCSSEDLYPVIRILQLFLPAFVFKSHKSQKIPEIISVVELQLQFAILDPGCFQDLVTVSDLRLYSTIISGKHI